MTTNKHHYQLQTDGLSEKERQYEKVGRKMAEIPVPKAWVVSGKLNEIQHSNGRFQLVLGRGVKLFGKLSPSELDVEVLRPLWGKQTTVEGMVHFEANGQPRLIEARRMSERVEGDRVFGKIPVADQGRTNKLLTIQGEPIRSIDLSELEDAWPGDEPIEDILAELD